MLGRGGCVNVGTCWGAAGRGPRRPRPVWAFAGGAASLAPGTESQLYTLTRPALIMPAPPCPPQRLAYLQAAGRGRLHPHHVAGGAAGGHLGGGSAGSLLLPDHGTLPGVNHVPNGPCTPRTAQPLYQLVSRPHKPAAHSSPPACSTTSWCCTPASCPRTRTPSWTASTRSAPSSTGAPPAADAWPAALGWAPARQQCGGPVPACCRVGASAMHMGCWLKPDLWHASPASVRLAPLPATRPLALPPDALQAVP